MKPDSFRSASDDPFSGVSELIGGILMITIVVGAVAIIAVILFSQPLPQKIPNVNFMTGTNAAGTELFLYHNGGDTLTRGEFAVLIDNLAPRTDYTVSDGSDEWSLGKNLILGTESPPHTVSLVYYEGNGGAVIIRSASSGVSSSKSINPSGTPVSAGGGSADDMCISMNQSPCLVPALLENLTANRIVFYKNSLDPQGGLAKDTVLSLRVKDTRGKSLIVYNNEMVKLNNSDVITIRIISQTKNFKAFGIAPQIWELAVDKADLTITRAPPVSTIVQPGASISHTWIDSYELVTSTLAVQTTGASATALTVNNTRYLPVPPSSTDSSDIRIYSARPLAIGLYVLIIDDSQHAAYLVGSADRICVGTNCGPYGL